MRSTPTRPAPLPRQAFGHEHHRYPTALSCNAANVRAFAAHIIDDMIPDTVTSPRRDESVTPILKNIYGDQSI